jgi:predicted ATPase
MTSCSPPRVRGIFPERQQTIRATVAWSYHLLDSDEQRTFRRLGALPARFPIEAAAAVLGGTDGDARRTDTAVGAAAGLIDKSLLLRADTTLSTRPLYQMLETVRAYAAIELDAAEERDDAMAGLVRYCRDEASRAADGLIGPEQGEWLDRIQGDLENYRVVLTWLLEHERAADACAITWRLLFFWLIRGRAAGDSSGASDASHRRRLRHRSVGARRGRRDAVHAGQPCSRARRRHARAGARER